VLDVDSGKEGDLRKMVVELRDWHKESKQPWICVHQLGAGQNAIGETVGPIIAWVWTALGRMFNELGDDVISDVELVGDIAEGINVLCMMLNSFIDEIGEDKFFTNVPYPQHSCTQLLECISLLREQ